MTVTAEGTKEITITLRRPHPKQQEFMESTAKRKIIRAGRRSGKTVGVAMLAIQKFLAGRRQLYTAPTGEQTDRFWFEVTRALRPLVESGVYKQNETERYIEKVGTENRIKAKTAWNANSLRGDYADDIYFDEWQLTAEDAWEDVGAPMLMDNNGDAVFIYTPPSLRSTSISRAIDPRHAPKMFKMAQRDSRWAAFHFTSHDNPNINQESILEITQDMSRDSYLKEIMAEDDDEQVNLLVYGCFNESVCKIPRFEIPKNWHVYTGHDFGSANPAALFVAQDPGTGFFYCFKEYRPSTGKSTFENVIEFKRMSVLPGGDIHNELAPKYNILQRIGGNHNTEDEIRQAYAAQGWPITAPYIERVKTQVDRVKQFMEKNKIFVFDDLLLLIEQLNTCMWKLDPFGRPMDDIKDEARYHLLACLRYLFSYFKPETVGNGRSSGGVRIAGINW